MQIVNAVIAVIGGIAAALALYWVLNKLAELLPGAWEGRIKPYLYILPAYAAITIYLIYPTILTLIYSFKDRFHREWVGFDNYTKLLGTAAFRDSLLNTVLWMIFVPTVTVALGLAIAVLADRLNPRAEKFSKTLIFLPMAISLIGSAKTWKFIYDYRTPAGGKDQIGLLNAVLTKILHVDPIPWLNKFDLHFNSFMLMVILLWSQIGFAMVLLSAAVKGVPGDTLEAARIDGANERQVFFRVVVPQIWGTVITVFITVTIGVMKTFDVVYGTTGGKFKTGVIASEFFQQYKFNDSGKMSAIVVMLLLAVLPIMVYQVRHFRAEEAAA
jgi:alpha-glucoside transport system permease protein